MASVSFAGKQIGMLAILIGIVLTGGMFEVDRIYIGKRLCMILSGLLMAQYPGVSRDIAEVSVTISRLEVYQYFTKKDLYFFPVCLSVHLP